MPAVVGVWEKGWSWGGKLEGATSVGTMGDESGLGCQGCSAVELVLL